MSLFKKHKIAGDVLIGADLPTLFGALKLSTPLRRLLKPEVEKLRISGDHIKAILYTFDYFCLHPFYSIILIIV